MDREGYEIWDRSNKKIFDFVKKEKDASLNVLGEGPLTTAHFQNFINGITKGEKLNSPISEGNVAATMLHLTNIAHCQGSSVANR